MDKMIFIIS